MNNIKKSVLLLAVFLFGAARLGAQKTDQYDGIYVMSFNIRYDTGQRKDGTNSWEFRWKSAVNMINTLKPDVIGLQELTPLQIPALKEYCEKYRLKGVGREDGKKKGEQTALMYNPSAVSLLKWGTFWLSETPDTPGPGWDAQCFRTATWGLFKSRKSGRRFLMVNTHLDHKGVKAREEGLRLICRKIDELNKDHLPVVLTGDFNMLPADPAFAVLEGTDLTDVRVAAERSDSEGSFHAWGKTSKVIDYIFAKGFGPVPMFRTVTEKYPDEAGEMHFVSDHFPIVSCLIF